MAALMAVLVQQAGDNGVLLRPLEHGGGVRLVQTRAAALLRRRQAIGLARAAHAAGIQAIGLATSFPAEYLREQAQPDYLLPDLKSILTML